MSSKKESESYQKQIKRKYIFFKTSIEFTRLKRNIKSKESSQIDSEIMNTTEK